MSAYPSFPKNPDLSARDQRKIEALAKYVAEVRLKSNLVSNADIRDETQQGPYSLLLGGTLLDSSHVAGNARREHERKYSNRFIAETDEFANSNGGSGASSVPFDVNENIQPNRITPENIQPNSLTTVSSELLEQQVVLV
jgi:hypothetical protein